MKKLIDFVKNQKPIVIILLIIMVFVYIMYINRKKLVINSQESNFAGTTGDESAITPTDGGAITPAPAPTPSPAPSLPGGSGDLTPAGTPSAPLTPPPAPPSPPSGGGSGSGGHHDHHRPYPYPYYPYPYYPYNYSNLLLLDTFDGGQRSSCYRRVTKDNGNTVCMSRREYIIYVQGRKAFWIEKLSAAKSSNESSSKINFIKNKLNKVNNILDSEGVN